MQQRGVFLLAVVLCVATHAMAQPTRDRQGRKPRAGQSRQCEEVARTGPSCRRALGFPIASEK
jgi:hypothetical protein